MTLKTKYTNDFWMTLFMGVLMVVLVVALGISFFNAILNTQLESRKEFLVKQTELAAHSLEIDIDRFVEDAKFLLYYLEEDDLDQEDFKNEFSTTLRRVFNSYPGLIDSVFVDLNDSLVSFTMTSRNNFIRSSFKGDFEEKKNKDQTFFIQGESGFKVLFALNLVKYSKNLVANYYLNPTGGKFLYLKNQLWDIRYLETQAEISIKEEAFEAIRNDVSFGVKGIYEVEKLDNKGQVKSVLVQYPFDFGEIEEDAALVFFVESEDLTSGVYNTYFFLFVGLVILLISSVVIFIRSINNNLESQRILREKGGEISELYLQQNLLLKQLGGFVFFHDSKGIITQLSDEVIEILGHPKEAIFNAFQKGTKNEDIKRLKSKIIQSVEKNQSSLDFEFDYNRGDGKKIRLRLFEKLIFDDSGNFKGGMGICTEITKQYKDRIELLKSENRLRSVIDNIPDIISIYDNQGNILDLHMKDQISFFESAGTLVGMNLVDITPKNQRIEILGAFELARKTGIIQTVEVRLKLPSGVKYFEVRYFPLDNSQIMSLAKDITSQKIWENGLVEAMNASDQASRAKSEFLANMSHEIRTPMNGLLGIIDMLEKTDLKKEQKLYVEIIKNSGNSLLGIIKDILDYSKIESGKIQIYDEVFSPAEELEKQIQLFIGLGQKKDLRITTHFGIETHDLVLGDKGKIDQIVINLVGNAVKFTPQGGEVTVYLDKEILSENLQYLNCRVKDTGIGIPEGFLSNLTDPFFQVESSSTRSFQGTGLGLAIAKKMIELLGGELTIKSEYGLGSEFSFSVLVKKAKDHVINSFPTISTERKDWSGMSKEYPMRILLAEDNDLNLQLMTLMLDQLGYPLEIARNGKEVLEKVKEQQFDLILMDVQMPVMNGLQATREIRKQLSSSGIWIIGLSANVFDEDQKKAIESGMDDYLTKPIRMPVLGSKLEQFYLKSHQKA
jgi:PAS domain S-box-containing protein